MPGEVFAGNGSFGVIGALGAVRMAVLVSRRVMADPEATRLIETLSRRTATSVVDLGSGEPKLDAIAGPLSAVTDFRPDWIVGIGGGSAIDAARLVWALYEHPFLTADVMERPHALPPLRSKARFAAVPTTTGSGAEASSVAVFQRSAGCRKSFLLSHELIPDVAILEPRLLYSVDPNVLLTSAGDALAHALEGLGSRLATPISDAIAETAARRLFSGLRQLKHRVDDDALSDLQIGAFMAGLVQNFAAPGLGHAVAHQLAAADVPHALSTAALLRAVIAVNTRASEKLRAKYHALGQTLAYDQTSTLSQIIHDCITAHVEASFDRAIRGHDTVSQEFVDGVIGDPCARSNPVEVTPELVAALFEVVAA